MNGHKYGCVLWLVGVCSVFGAQQPELVPVQSKTTTQIVDLPGELQPFQIVSLHAKVRGFVKRVLVDRGSPVRQGQLLAEVTAPEIEAQAAEAESKVLTADAERLEAEAQLTALQSTRDRLRKAAETPGAISGNEVVQAEKQVEAAQAVVLAKRQSVTSIRAAARAQKQLESYLRIAAPFDGLVTDRLVHPGTLVGPGADPVIFVIQQLTKLRLVVAVPELNLGRIARGTPVHFRVPAYPERVYAGKVARISHVLDPKTRTMAVELDVVNGDGSLSPGMYPSVSWQSHGTHSSLLVPRTSVVVTTERTFVIRSRDVRAEWVTVTQGAVSGDLIEVAGNLSAGDRVVRRATDEIRNGMPLRIPGK